MNGLKIFLTNMSQNVDIHACSITEHAFLQSTCTGSLIAFMRDNMSMFSD